MKQKTNAVFMICICTFLLPLTGQGQPTEPGLQVSPKQAVPGMVILPFALNQVSQAEAQKVTDLFLARLSPQYRSVEAAAEKIDAAGKKTLLPPVAGLDNQSVIQLGRSLGAEIILLGSLAHADNAYHLQARIVEINLERTIFSIDTGSPSLAGLTAKLNSLLAHPLLLFPNANPDEILLEPVYDPDADYDYQITYYEDTVYLEPVYLDYQELRKPLRLSAKKTFEKPGKICLYKNYIFVNEINQGIHVIDNSDSQNPHKTAFLPVPGNIDLAVKDDVLYADSYVDLVLIDISRIGQAEIRTLQRREDIFPYNADLQSLTGLYSHPQVTPVDKTRGIVIDLKVTGSITEMQTKTLHHYPRYWNEIPESLTSTHSIPQATSSTQANTGIGGSLARFLIVAGYLYVIDNNSLNLFDIAVPEEIKPVKKVIIGRDIETIFAYAQKLFIGGRQGMYIYDNTTPFDPRYISTYSHMTMYDPVVVAGHYAFVTLRDMPETVWLPEPNFPGSGVALLPASEFRRINNSSLEIVDLQDIKNPRLERSIAMDAPYGLAVDGNLLVVCDRWALVLLDINQFRVVDKIPYPATPYDVILQNGMALVVTKQAIHFHAYKVTESEFSFEPEAAHVIW